MIWFIIVPIIFFVVAFAINNGSYYNSMTDTIGLSVFWAFLGLLPALALAALVGSILPHEEQNSGHLEIVALADATHTEGQFYLFGGTIESEPVYRYYYRSDGGYKMGWKLVGDSLIVESETETPRYDKIEEVRGTDWWGISNTAETRYIFYVPPGTVTNTFDLDLEG